MYLLTAATRNEMFSVCENVENTEAFDCLVTGVGPVESAYALTRYLCESGREVAGVVNFGVAGAYQHSRLQLLDLCLADKEILGDTGICYENSLDYFDDDCLSVQNEYVLKNPLTRQIEEILAYKKYSFAMGVFITVCATSGSKERGLFLEERWQALCENMEGAALARVCEGFGLPFAELRCISNMVEDRNTSGWRLPEAISQCAGAVLQVIREFETYE